ncbi:AraC family transcriptional regulator [Pantanalinema rosaneae CENA516]|uniref:AraC family transcriptional regulator n=1 Tax=Pantanalinema rosaneae TaxID=1620701 RepID=UPI003D6E958C
MTSDSKPPTCSNTLNPSYLFKGLEGTGCRANNDFINIHIIGLGYTDTRGDGAHQTAISQLEFMRESAASTAIRGVFEPVLAIVIQGKKEALLGEETYQYGAAQYLVISVDLPLSGFVTEATPDKPYLGFKFSPLKVI